MGACACVHVGVWMVKIPMSVHVGAGVYMLVILLEHHL